MKNSLNAILGKNVESSNPLQIKDAGDYTLEFVGMRSYSNHEESNEPSPFKDNQTTYVAMWKEHEGIQTHEDHISVYGFYKDLDFPWMDKYTPCAATLKNLDLTRSKFNKLPVSERKILVFEIPEGDYKHYRHVDTNARVEHAANTARARERMLDLLTVLSGEDTFDPDKVVAEASKRYKLKNPIVVTCRLAKSKSGRDFMDITDYIQVQ